MTRSGMTRPPGERVLAAVRGVAARPVRSLVLASRGQQEWLGSAVARVPLGDLDLPSAALLAARLCERPIAPGPELDVLLRWVGGHPQVLSAVVPAALDADPLEVLAALRQGGQHRLGPSFDSPPTAWAVRVGCAPVMDVRPRRRPATAPASHR